MKGILWVILVSVATLGGCGRAASIPQRSLLDECNNMTISNVDWCRSLTFRGGG
jgi:hypothetical protein